MFIHHHLVDRFSIMCNIESRFIIHGQRAVNNFAMIYFSTKTEWKNSQPVIDVFIDIKKHTR